MIMTSRATPRRPASTIIRPRRGSIGSWARSRPTFVRPLPVSSPEPRAPSSVSSCVPSRTERVSGGSTNGNFAMSSGVVATPTAIICRITDASDVRRISGSVNSGREAKSCSEYSRIAMPSATRPHRPERWFADACEMGSMGSRCTFVAFEYREMRAVPGSITYRMPGTVNDVSATLVASTTRRLPCCWNTRCCSAADSRPYNGRISTASGRRRSLARSPRCERSASSASRISRSPEKNTRMSPGPSAASSSKASQMAVSGSRSSTSRGFLPPRGAALRAPDTASTSGSGSGSGVSGR